MDVYRIKPVFLAKKDVIADFCKSKTGPLPRLSLASSHLASKKGSPD